MLAADRRSGAFRAPLGRSLTRRASISTPLGPLAFTEEDGTLVALDFGAVERSDRSPLLDETARQLTAYFARRLRAFDLPLGVRGTDHQRRVWTALRAIPFGATRTYGDIARAIGSAPRAVGQACAANKLLIIVPCHRIVATDGLGGFGGAARNLDTKRALLALEGALPLQDGAHAA